MPEADRPPALLDEGLTLVEGARAAGIPLRLMGALGVERRCRNAWRIAVAEGRATGDIDLVGLSKHWNALIELFVQRGYTFDERHAMLHGRERLNFFHPSTARADVFLDRLTMCHDLDLRARLDIHPETLSLADLLLQKLQIVELTRKDVIDTIVMLHEHPITDDESGLNAGYIAATLARDWGFWYTATQNLSHIRDESLYELDSLSRQDAGIVLKRLERLLTDLDTHPKTLGWKARATIGARIKWYRDVGELVR